MQEMEVKGMREGEREKERERGREGAWWRGVMWSGGGGRWSEDEGVER